MKTFVQFSVVFPVAVVEFDGRTYGPDEHKLLHDIRVPVHKYFDRGEELLSVGRFVWSDQTGRLYLQFWLSVDECRHFERRIFSGEMVPMNIKFAFDTVSDESAKGIVDDPSPRGKDGRV